VLQRFLEHWRQDIEARLHLIRIAHTHWQGPSDWRAVDDILPLG
jgi:uncharacterized protein Usg